ncbi:hypothetical protein [uncultured Campylobacter sp.]|uniref:hypothetical protein n=1 Tax=uncultured Campylobacter sp. TaxID=218934 RepID=UPI002623082C|nr:hypothetical protein [uncultured Campylobacter sp.]
MKFAMGAYMQYVTEQILDATTYSKARQCALFFFRRGGNEPNKGAQSWALDGIRGKIRWKGVNFENIQDR